MSTQRFPLRAFSQATRLKQRLPYHVAQGLLYGCGAAGLTLALLAHRAWPFRFGEVLGVFIVCLAGMALSSYHTRYYPVKGVNRVVADRITWFTIFLAVSGMQMANYVLKGEVARPEIAPLIAAPLVALGMLASGLLGPAKGINAVTFAAVGAMSVTVTNSTLIAGAWLTAAIGAHAVNPLRHRNDLFRATYVTTAAFAVVTLALSALAGLEWREALLSGSWAVAGGIGATALFWLAIAAFEKAFGVVSDWTLLELCSPDHPLLRDLVIRAPGTYAHSVMVGNLSERAATAIDANALLCRAMAYYHDIGKLRRPEYFIENKLADNPHDKITPALSAKIISAHVKDGLAMAEEHKLPPLIKDAIAEHHGTSLISYFYHLWTRDSGENDPILKQHFRYSGPRPRSKETAVLMLADRVEAATRTLVNASPGRLRSFVWEIVQDVRDDGQLDDSELNFRDLQTIVDAFVASLNALRHERIEYPGGSADALEDEAQNLGHEGNETKVENNANEAGAHQNAGD